MRAFLIPLSLLLASPVSAKTPFWPPDLGDEIAKPKLAEVDEPPLWPAKALGHFQNRFRLSVVGPGCGIYTIRLDEKLDGRGMITAKGWNKCKQDAPYNEIRLTRRANDIGEIISAFDVAQLWLIYPQKIPERYDIEHDNICLDQSYTLIFERRDKAGYGFTQVDSCSIHAEKALDAAFKLRLLAGLSAHLSERP